MDKNPLPKFAPSGPNPTSFIDLNDIFADHFFPEDINFTNFFQNDLCGIFDESIFGASDAEFMLKIDDNGSLITGGLKSRNTSLLNLESFLENENESEINNVLLIPPTRPTFSTTDSAQVSKIHHENLNSVQKREMLSTNKFNKVTPAVPLNNNGSSSSSAHFTGDHEADDWYDDSEEPRKRKMKKTSTAESAAAYKIERRERNREHAKKSRVRKKVMLETYSDQLAALRFENVNLRRVVTEKIPHLAAKILHDCTTCESNLLSSTHTEDGGCIMLSHGHGHDPGQGPAFGSSSSMSGFSNRQQYAKILMEPDFRLIQALLHSQQNFCLSDPTLPDNPIVFCSDGFCKLTGYSRQEVLGRNCRFLQGPGTDQNAVDMIRKGVAEGRDISVCLLNYKADGSPFWNQFFVAALRDAGGTVVNFAGIQCEVNSMPISEIKDRVKKLPMPSSI